MGRRWSREPTSAAYALSAPEVSLVKPAGLCQTWGCAAARAASGVFESSTRSSTIEIRLGRTEPGRFTTPSMSKGTGS